MRASTLFLAGLMAVTGIATQAQTVDEIVSKHVDAVGGLDNWKKITSIKREGSFNVQGTDVTVTITVLNNKGSRQDITVGGTAGYVIVTPTAGWSFLPFQGQSEVENMPAETLKDRQPGLDAAGALIDYKAKGHKVELQGKETIDGVECYKLKVTHSNGTMVTDYIDTKNYYMVRTVSTQHANGQEVEQTVSFSNFQKLPEGIVVAMTITQQFGDITITKVEVNKPVDESIFKAS